MALDPENPQPPIEDKIVRDMHAETLATAAEEGWTEEQIAYEETAMRLLDEYARLRKKGVPHKWAHNVSCDKFPELFDPKAFQPRHLRLVPPTR